MQQLSAFAWFHFVHSRRREDDGSRPPADLQYLFASYRETVKVALVHLDATDQSERVVDAIRATATDTEEDIAGHCHVSVVKAFSGFDGTC